MTHVDNRSRSAALAGLLLDLGCLCAAPPGIAAQAPTGLGRVSVSVGVAGVLPADLRFVDGEDAGEAALYGDDQSDAGTLAAGLESGLAAGYRFGAFRAQVELAVTGRFAFEPARRRAAGLRIPLHGRRTHRHGHRRHRGGPLAPLASHIETGDE